MKLSRGHLRGNLRVGNGIDLGAVKRLLMFEHAVDGVEEFAHGSDQGPSGVTQKRPMVVT